MAKRVENGLGNSLKASWEITRKTWLPVQNPREVGNAHILSIISARTTEEIRDYWEGKWLQKYAFDSAIDLTP